jgi:hypothetical protein
MWHQTRMPERVDSLRPEVPVELADLVERMLAKRPADRPRTMNEVAEALVPWASQAPRPEKRSPRSLAELRACGPRTGALGGVSTAHLLSGGASPDTLISQTQEDTAQIEPETPSPLERRLRDITLGEESGSTKLLILGGLAGTMLALTGAVLALLIWGPHP